jgi:hypothetical protein
MLIRTSGKVDRYRVGVDRIAEDRVSKFVGPNAAIEFQKAQAIERALAGSRFSTPKALCYSADTGRVEFEYIPDTRTLLEVMEEAHRHRDFSQTIELNRLAAEMLAVLHRNLTLPSAVRWIPPESLVQDSRRNGLDLDALEQVHMHCDYSPVNILVTPNSELVLIDASPNYYFTHRADLIGPRYVALATYTTKLFWPFRVRTYSYCWRKMAHQLRHDFVHCYAEDTSASIDPKALHLFERASARSFVTWKTRVVPVRWIALLMSRVALPAANS